MSEVVTEAGGGWFCQAGRFVVAGQHRKGDTFCRIVHTLFSALICYSTAAQIA